MSDADGPGKAPKVRKHSTAKSPYARPAPATGSRSAVTPNPLSDQAPGTDGKASLFNSMLSAATTPLRAAAGLINKVPMFSGYFGAAAGQDPHRHDAEDKSDADAEMDGNSPRLSAGNPRPITDIAGPSQPYKSPSKASPKELPANGAPVAGAENGGEISLAMMMPQGDAGAVHGHENGTTAAAAAALTGPTPYDGVLEMLRSGPMHLTAKVKFPKPRTKAERDAAVAAASAEAIGRSAANAPIMVPNPAFVFGEASSPANAYKPSVVGGGSPVPVPVPGFAAGSGGRRGAEFSQRRYVASRLGPFAAPVAGGVSGAPGSGLRAGTRPAQGFGFSRFARAPTPAGGGEGGVLPGALPAFAQQEQQQAGVGGARAMRSLASPAPLAWTPMRSTPASAFRPGSTGGSKRKADSETPVEHDHPGSISILDAQRRIRQRSESAAAAPSTDRRSWRAGRTPFHSQSSRLGSRPMGSRGPLSAAAGGGGGAAGTPARPASLSPVPLVGFAGATPIPFTAAGTTIGTPDGSGSPKPTTDTARRILETLDQLDKSIRPAKRATPGGGGATPDRSPPPGPPPSESLGEGLLKPKQTSKDKAGDANGEGEGAAPKARRPRVTFAELTGVESPGRSKDEEEAVQEKKKKKQAAAAAAAAESESAPSTTPASPEEQAGPKKEEEKAAAPAQPKFNFGGGTVPQVQAPTSTTEKAGDQYVFGKSGGDKELRKKVAAAVAGAATAALAGEPAPTFLFGKDKKKKSATAAAAAAPPMFNFGASTTTTPQVVAPSPELLAANRLAAEAAKSPLPEMESEGEEEKGSPSPASQPTSIKEPSEKEKDAQEEEQAKPAAGAPAAAAGGWDMSFLQSNQQAASAATDAAKRAIDTGAGGASQASTPAAAFSFGAPNTTTTGSAPAFSFGVGGAAASTGAASETKAPAFGAVPSVSAVPSFLAPASAAATTTTPTFGFTASAPAFTGATEVEPEKEKAAPAPAAAPAASGWGDAFLKSNQDIASKAAEAAAKEAEGKKEVSAPVAFKFGVPDASASIPAFGATAAAPAAEIKFNFGGAVAAAAPTAQPFGQLAPIPEAASKPAATEPATAPAPAPFGAPAPAGGLFGFGGATGAAAGATNGAAFSFGASSAPATTQPEPTPSAAPTTGFGFGGGAASEPAPTFTFGAQPSSGAAFTFGATPASAPPPASTPAAETPDATGLTFGSGAPAVAAASQASPAPAFNFSAGGAPALSPSTGFAFGAPQSAPAPAAAAVSGGFGFGSQPSQPASLPSFGMSSDGGNGPKQPSPMEANNNGSGGGGGFGGGFGGAGATTPTFGNFGAPQSAAPAFGTGFGAPQQQQQSMPAFGSGIQPASSPPVFGGGGGFGQQQQQQQPGGGGFGTFGQTQQPPTFGAPSQPPTFGAPSSSMPPPAFGAGFGAGGGGAGGMQPQPFGLPQQAPGAMVPNNPFGGGVPGGGFSIGSAGNSQSEGRRKLKVKRSGRK